MFLLRTGDSLRYCIAFKANFRNVKFVAVSSEQGVFLFSVQVHNPKRQVNRADPGALTLEMLMKNSLGKDGTDPKLLDFLSQCLHWNPLERITASEALHHPWILEIKVSNLDIVPDPPKRDSDPSLEAW